MDDDEFGLKVMSGETDRSGSHVLPADIIPPAQGLGTSKTLADADKRRLAKGEGNHKRVTRKLKKGCADMVDYMADCKLLMKTCSPSEMHRQRSQYDGFYRYAKTLEEIAQRIQELPYVEP